MAGRVTRFCTNSTRYRAESSGICTKTGHSGLAGGPGGENLDQNGSRGMYGNLEEIKEIDSARRKVK